MKTNVTLDIKLKNFLHCDPSQSVQKKRHGIIYQFSVEIAVRFRNIFHLACEPSEKGATTIA